MSVADPGKRFVAYLIDIAPAAVLYILGLIIGSAGFMLLIMLAVFAYFLYNSVYLQGTTGQSIGKKQQGLKLVKSDTGQPVTPVMAFVRWLLGGVLGSICFLDYWIILVDKDKRRISDKILGFHVYSA